VFDVPFRESSTHSPLSIGPHRDDHAPATGTINQPCLRFLLYIGRIAVTASLFYASVWVAVVILLWSAQSNLIFETDQSRQFTAPLDVHVFRPVALHTPDGLTLEGVVLAHADAAGSYWMLFCLPAGASIHGLRMQGQLRKLWELGYNVLAFDYRGFGENRGSPTEQGLYADGATAYQYLTRQRGVPATRVILAGRSLGSAVAIELATRVDAAGVLMFGAIDSVPLTARRLFPWAPASFLTRSRFDSLAKVKALHVPVVMVHAFDDELVPLSTARAMFQEIRAPKLMIATYGGHDESGFTIATQLGAQLAKFWPPN
jgi:fermentation-respiration switch protein FrsA (DUF1100 family)